MEDILKNINIPADEITPETVSKGIIVRLHPNEIIWKSDSGKINLNFLQGDVFYEIKGSSLSEAEVNQVYNGIKAGRLLCVKKIEKVDKPNIEMSFDPNAPTARRILDLPDGEFESAIIRFKRIPILELALSLEAQEGGRKGRMDLIRKQIALFSDK